MGSVNTGFTVYQAWGGGGWGNPRKFWVKMWLRGRHQDTKMLVKKRGEAKLFKNDSEVPGPVM